MAQTDLVTPPQTAATSPYSGASQSASADAGAEPGRFEKLLAGFTTSEADEASASSETESTDGSAGDTSETGADPQAAAMGALFASGAAATMLPHVSAWTPPPVDLDTPAPAGGSVSGNTLSPTAAPTPLVTNETPDQPVQTVDAASLKTGELNAQDAPSPGAIRIELPEASPIRVDADDSLSPLPQAPLAERGMAESSSFHATAPMAVPSEAREVTADGRVSNSILNGDLAGSESPTPHALAPLLDRVGATPVSTPAPRIALTQSAPTEETASETPVVWTSLPQFGLDEREMVLHEGHTAQPTVVVPETAQTTTPFGLTPADTSITGAEAAQRKTAAEVLVATTTENEKPADQNVAMERSTMTSPERTAVPFSEQSRPALGDEQHSRSRDDSSRNTDSPSRTSGASTPDAERAQAVPFQQVQNTEASRESSATDTPARTDSLDRHRVIEQVTQRLETMRLTQGRQELTLHLRPDHLGEVRLNIVADRDSITAHVVAETEQVRQAVQENREQLRSALEQRGYSLQSLDVSLSQQGGGQRFASFAPPASELPRQLGGTPFGGEREREVAPILPMTAPSQSAGRLDTQA